MLTFKGKFNQHGSFRICKAVYVTRSGVTGNKSLGRSFSLLPVHYRMTNIGTTRCIQPQCHTALRVCVHE